MAPLPGWLFMIAGVAVSGYVKYIESKSDNKLSLFFWLGIAFVLYGFGKEVVKRLGKKHEKQELQEPPAREEVHADHGTAHKRTQETHKHVQGQQHPSHPHNPNHKGCGQCHAPNHVNANFCHKCGGSF
ncbi:MAG: zinc ribbon domain-containing protein [Candidatus Woesearchaeota archaeon]|nr:zinc ribbon domain-containing protein [Candidatus Woesearchaeota archaeon]